MAVRDPTTSSNYDAWRTKHTTANLKIDFQGKCLRGLVTLELESQTDKASNEIVLDSSFVSVSSVKVDSAPSEWEVKDRTEPLGSPVRILVPAGAARGDVVKVDIEVATTANCTALQWLTPEQTSSKKAPFMFSQCQAIHARSLFPCQDSPDIKSTYTFRITSPYVVVASGVASGEPEAVGAASGDDKLYTFEQKVPIPSYLFALASGDIAQAPIGPRSFVATGPGELKSCQWEFERDMEKFMEAAERIVFPYKWGQYNVLVLPPSFPYGGEPISSGVFPCKERLTRNKSQGMENPIYTFATPTIVSFECAISARLSICVCAEIKARSLAIEKTSMWSHMSYLTAGAATWLQAVAGSICEFYGNQQASLVWLLTILQLAERGLDHVS